ncbi:MAG: pseudouridine synthase, partial [Oscillospiraceae bacterium]|nr:pseudouridine synthase [Oscillospiraceae bacterium]
ALKSFEGESFQLPPMYSAVKRGGKKLYELARKGLEVERDPRKIVLSDMRLISGEGNEFTFEVTCSKGTYIRTLCSDIGEKLGCGGAMSALRRIRAGAFGIEEAVSLKQIEACENKASLLKSVDMLFRSFPEFRADASAEKKCRCGADFECGDIKDGKYRVYSANGGFLMLGEAENGVMKTVKSFFEV